MFPTLSCPVAGVQSVPRVSALGVLREFRERLRGCLTARADALFELADLTEVEVPSLRAVSAACGLLAQTLGLV